MLIAAEHPNQDKLVQSLEQHHFLKTNTRNSLRRLQLVAQTPLTRSYESTTWISSSGLETVASRMLLHSQVSDFLPSPSQVSH